MFSRTLESWFLRESSQNCLISGLNYSNLPRHMYNIYLSIYLSIHPNIKKKHDISDVTHQESWERIPDQAQPMMLEPRDSPAAASLGRNLHHGCRWFNGSAEKTHFIDFKRIQEVNIG